MPDILILATNLDIPVGGTTLYVSGQVVADGVEDRADWSATFGWNATPAQANAAIVAAAEQAAESAFSISVGALDNKTLLGGAVGLV